MRTGCLREGPSVAYVDLNSDLGESFGQYKVGEDEEMMKIISSANVACGFHGGDPLVMHETCLLYTSPSPRDRQKSRMPSSA